MMERMTGEKKNSQNKKKVLGSYYCQKILYTDMEENFDILLTMAFD